MLIVLAVFTILILYDVPRFIKNKEPARLYITYILLILSSLTISLLLAAGKNPISPTHIIEIVLQKIGVIN